MSGSLRYKNPVIYEHLAHQYVAGSITPQVRARIESLRQTVPELDRAISKIADDFSDIHLQLPSTSMQSKDLDRIWDNIDSKIPNEMPRSFAQDKTENLGFWNSLFFWRFTAGLGMAMSCALGLVLLPAHIVPPAGLGLADVPKDALIDALELKSDAAIPSIPQGPSYLATMAAHDDPNAVVQFIISAYSKQPGVPSRLHLQWSEAHAGKVSHPPLHLWAEDRDSGELTYIGMQPQKEKPWDLNKATWTAVSNSSRLLMTTNELLPNKTNLTFSGNCLQLKPWKKSEPA